MFAAKAMQAVTARLYFSRIGAPTIGFGKVHAVTYGIEGEDIEKWKWLF